MKPPADLPDIHRWKTSRPIQLKPMLVLGWWYNRKLQCLTIIYNILLPEIEMYPWSSLSKQPKAALMSSIFNPGIIKITKIKQTD